jgi:hypothetical protein
LEVNVVNNPNMKVIADSFAWPFRGEWKSAWLLGLLATLFLPIAFVPLLGYAIAATRAAETDPTKGPPRWALSTRLLTDGLWTTIAVTLLTAPFVLAINQVAATLYGAHLWHVSDTALSQLYAHVVATFLLTLTWGLVMLLFMPHATARFARTGRPWDLFYFRRSVDLAFGRDFATWNLVAAAIVTGWAIGLACVGLFCIGLVAGIFYAILVCAHATAVLEHKGPKGKNPPAR